MNRNLLLLAAALATQSCKKDRAPTEPVVDAATPLAATDAASAPPDADAARADAGAAKMPASLLELVPSSLAVSSTVKNPHDYPEHLIDGKLDTAWNSKTGDLVGAWIRFEVPADAKVDAVEITAGYTRSKGDEDLFLQNHRIAKLQVSHDGKIVKTHALDVNSRELQRIELDGGGGEYELRVLETVPGSKKEWRELTVSELRVHGQPGRERRPQDQTLRVGVGSYTLFMPTRPPEPVGLLLDGQAFDDLGALCAAWPEAAKKIQAKKPKDYADQRIAYGTPSCTEEASNVRFTGDATFAGVAAIRVSDGYVRWSAPVVHLASGWTAIDYRYREDDPMDPGCPSTPRPVLIDTAAIKNGFLQLTTGSTQGSSCESTKDDPALAGYCVVLLRGAMWCKAGATLRCQQYAPEYQEPLAIKDAPNGDPLAEKGWGRAGAWRDVLPFTVLPNGDFRLR